MRQIFFAISDNIVLFISNILLLIFFVRILSPEEYGLYVSVFFLLAILDLSTNGFYNQALVKYLTESKQEERHVIFSTVLYLKFAILFLYSIIIILFASAISGFFNTPELSKIILITPIIGFLANISQTSRYVVVAKKKINNLFKADTLSLILMIILLIIVYIFKLLNTSTAALLIFAASHLFLSFSIWIFNKDSLKITLPKTYWIKRLSSFGIFNFLGASSSFFLERFDGILILYFLNPALLGAYDALRKLSEGIVKNVVNSFRIVVYPNIISAFNENIKKVEKEFKFYTMIIFLFCLPFIILLIFFPVLLIKIAYGFKYAEYFYLLPVFGAGTIFRAFTQTGGAALDAMGKPNMTFIFTFIGSLVVVAINLILIPKIGILGAAISSSFFFLLDALLLFFYLKKIIKIGLIDLLEELRNILSKYIPAAINKFSTLYIRK